MRTALKLLTALAVLVLALSLGGCGGTTGSGTDDGAEPKTSGEPIKIGAILSLTGTYAGLGAPEKNVLEMEEARINEAGGVNGRPIDIVIEDDATDEAKSVQAASKLIDQEKVVVLLAATGSGQTMAIRQQVDAAKVPQVSMAGATAITAKFDPLVFQTPWSNTIVVPFTMKYLQGKGIKKIGLITDTGGFGKDGRAVITEQAPKFGIEIAADEVFNAGDADMTSQLTKLKQAAPDAIVMWTAGKEASTIAKNREQLAIAAPLYGSHGNARMEFAQGAGAAAEGFQFPAGKILIPSSWGEGTDEFKVATDFRSRYKAAYGKDPDTFAGHAYDALYLAVEAMKRLPADFTSAQLRDEIEKTSGWVGIGGKFTFSPTDHNGLSESDLVMYRVDEGGGWALAD